MSRTTVKDLEKRIDDLEDKIEKLIKVVNKRNWYPPYEKPEKKKCPCCGGTIKIPYDIYDRVVY